MITVYLHPQGKLHLKADESQGLDFNPNSTEPYKMLLGALPRIDSAQNPPKITGTPHT